MNQDVIQVPLVGVADVNTVLIERSELRRLHEENQTLREKNGLLKYALTAYEKPKEQGHGAAPAPQNLYQITGNVADMNTVLIERAELHRLQAENNGLRILASGGMELFERYSTFKAKCAELEAMLDAVGAGGVGESIKPPVPTGWKLVPVKHTLDMSIAFAETWYSERRCIDDPDMQDAWQSMIDAAPEAPAQSCCTCTKTADLHKAPAPAPAQQKPVAWIDVKPNPFDPSCRGAASVQDHALPPGEHKLYAAPNPARQPLTDEQVLNLGPGQDCAVWSYESQIYFARAVEAAHGITGGQQ